MEKLDAKTEQSLRKLSRRQSVRAVLYTLLWWGTTAGLWGMYAKGLQRGFTDPGSFVFLLALIVPFFPFGLHRYLFGRTYYATVKRVEVALEAPLKWYDIPNRRRLRNNNTNMADTMTMTLRTDKGEQEKMTLIHPNITGGEGGHYYDLEDRVLVLRGTAFPVKVPMELEKGIVCPVCGEMIGFGKSRCSWCKNDLLK